MSKTRLKISHGNFEGLEVIKSRYDAQGKRDFDIEFRISAREENINIDYILYLLEKLDKILPRNEYGYDVAFNFCIERGVWLSKKDKNKLLKLQEECKAQGLGDVYLSDVRENEHRYTLEQSITAGEKLENVAKFVKNAQVEDEQGEKKPLSVYEKYLLVYSYVTQFIYKSESEEMGQGEDISRFYVPVLTGDKIVCVGYVDLLERLCEKIFAPTQLKVMQLSVDITSEEFEKEAFHRMAAVYINDKEYGIRGVFASDPTNDSLTPKVLQGIAMSAYPFFDDKFSFTENLFDTKSLIHKFLIERDPDYREKCLKFFAKSGKSKFGSPFYIDYGNTSCSDFIREIADGEMQRQILGVPVNAKMTEAQKKTIKEGSFSYDGMAEAFEQLIKTPAIPVSAILNAIYNIGMVYESKGMIESRSDFVLDTLKSSEMRAKEMFQEKAQIRKIYEEIKWFLQEMYGREGMVTAKQANRAFVERFSWDERIEDLNDVISHSGIPITNQIKIRLSQAYAKLQSMIKPQKNLLAKIPEAVLEEAEKSPDVFNALANIAISGFYTKNGRQRRLTDEEKVALFGSLLEIAERQNQEDSKKFEVQKTKKIKVSEAEPENE